MPTVVPIRGPSSQRSSSSSLSSRSFEGVRGTDAILWNAVGVITLLYLFTSVAWVASGVFRNRRQVRWP